MLPHGLRSDQEPVERDSTHTEVVEDRRDLVASCERSAGGELSGPVGGTG